MTDVDESRANPETFPEAPNEDKDFAHASKAWDATNVGAPSPALALSLVDDEDAPDHGKTTRSNAAQSTHVRDVLIGAQEVVQRNYRAASETTRDFVHESPWQAIAMAAIGGVVIGMLVSG